MTAHPDFPAPVPLVSAEVTEDLVGETAYLAEALRQPLVRTAGATGILNSVAPSTVWVVGDLDIDELVAEIVDCDPAPEVMVPYGSIQLASRLARHGWDFTHVVDRLRRDLTPTTDPIPRFDQPGTVPIRAAAYDDLPVLRSLYVEAFEAEDSAEYVPDELLDVPDLALFVAEEPTDPDLVVGTVGVRLRHRGALIFGLAVTPEHRRRGLATALIARSLTWAAGQGAPYALADVDAPAPLLWHRLGFESTSRWHRCCREL